MTKVTNVTRETTSAINNVKILLKRTDGLRNPSTAQNFVRIAQGACRYCIAPWRWCIQISSLWDSFISATYAIVSQILNLKVRMTLGSHSQSSTMVCNNHVSVLHYFRDITTYSAYVTAVVLRQSFILFSIVKIITAVWLISYSLGAEIDAILSEILDFESLAISKLDCA